MLQRKFTLNMVWQCVLVDRKIFLLRHIAASDWQRSGISVAKKSPILRGNVT
jgi:hypothetical protein